MDLQLRVTTTEDTYDVRVTFGNVCEWEEATNKVASELAKGIGYRDLARLAFFASRTAGRTVPAVYKDFEKRIVNVDVIEEQNANPTTQEPGATA